MYQLIKRLFDIISSLVVLSVLLPFFLIITLLIVLDSRGGAFYKQTRVGKGGKEFGLLKFRSMKPNSDKSGQLTVGADSRVTKLGHFIRKYKIDEFPQLLNIIAGQMSIVGPRPEVPKYVAFYSDEQREVLSVRPGLTDFATLEYFDEQKILGEATDPEAAYINEVMPKKLELSLRYVVKSGMALDVKLIFRTIGRIFK